MSAGGPLSGKLVAVTRPLEVSQRLGLLLEARGAAVLLAPAIERSPPESWEALDQGIERLLSGGYQGVLFTSAAAVEPFLLRLAQGGGALPSLRGLLIGAVGRGTAAALEERGIQVQVCPEREDGEALAEAVVERLGADLEGMRFLQPRAQEGRTELSEGLERGGAVVDVAAAYRTLPLGAEALTQLAEALAAGEVDSIVFASPSAVEAARASCGIEALREAAAVAIGETTADAIRERLGLPVTVAEGTNDEALVEAVIAALS